MSAQSEFAKKVARAVINLRTVMASANKAGYGVSLRDKAEKEIDFNNFNKVTLVRRDEFTLDTMKL